MPPRRARSRGRSGAKSKSNDQEKEDTKDQLTKNSDNQKQEIKSSNPNEKLSASQTETKNDSQNINTNKSNSEPTSQIFESIRQRNSATSRTSASRNSNANSNSASASANTSFYGSNHRSSARTGNNSSRDSPLFQDRIIEILKNSRSQSLTVDEIINKATDFKNDDGLYQNLPLDKRVRCVLQVKKVLKEVVYDENTSKWSLPTRSTDKQKNFLPKELKGVKMKELTINELWNLLKEKNIY